MSNKGFITSFNRSFGVESEIVPYGKLWESLTELEALESPLKYSSNLKQHQWLLDIQEEFSWLYSSREFLLYVIGGESYSHGSYDEELEILSKLVYRFLDLMKVFVNFLSYGVECPHTDVDSQQIEYLYDSIMSYSKYFRYQWEKKLKTEKKENYEDHPVTSSPHPDQESKDKSKNDGVR